MIMRLSYLFVCVLNSPKKVVCEDTDHGEHYSVETHDYASLRVNYSFFVPPLPEPEIVFLISVSA
jgi:hypothetical protein